MPSLRLYRVAAAALTAAAALVAPAPPAGGAEDLRLDFSIAGRDLATAGANRPLELRGDRPVIVAVRVANDGAAEVFVRSVRIDGRVMGLTFFSYETRIDLRVAAGGEEQRRYALDLVDLTRQATGLLPARLALLDSDRRVVAERRFVADVDGSVGSVYGVFGMLVGACTLVLLAGTLLRLATDRLSANRWKRGVRFATAGAGVGLTLTFSFSAFRVLSPDPSRWLPLVIGSAVALFVVGYLTPTPRQTRQVTLGEGGTVTVDLTDAALATPPRLPSGP